MTGSSNAFWVQDCHLDPVAKNVSRGNGTVGYINNPFPLQNKSINANVWLLEESFTVDNQNLNTQVTLYRPESL